MSTYCVFPPTLMYGFFPLNAAIFSSKVSENVFGRDLFPAKSGKLENSMEKPTKLSRIGAAAPSGEPLTTMALRSVGRGSGLPSGVMVVAAAVQRATRVEKVASWSDDGMARARPTRLGQKARGAGGGG